MDNNSIAIYNSDEKKVAYVASSVSEASRIIFGHSTVTYDGIVRRYSKSHTLIKKDGDRKCILGYNVAVRDTNTEQRKLLSTNKFIKI